MFVPQVSLLRPGAALISFVNCFDVVFFDAIRRHEDLFAGRNATCRHSIFDISSIELVAKLKWLLHDGGVNRAAL